MDFFDETTTIKRSDPVPQPQTNTECNNVRLLHETTNFKKELKIEKVSISTSSKQGVHVPNIRVIPVIKKENSLNKQVILSGNSTSQPKIIRILPNSNQPGRNKQITPINVANVNMLRNNNISVLKRSGEVMLTASPKIPKFEPANGYNNYYMNSHFLAEEYRFKNNELGEMTYSDAYSNYQQVKNKIGQQHPSKIVESKSLSTEESPPAKYKLHLPANVIHDGILSDVQLDAVIYACQRHETFLSDGRRAGFFIGDGAGVGKGRTIAGIIYENYLLGRKKAVWVSVSNDLKEDAKRDLKDLCTNGGPKINVRSLNKMSYLKIDSRENGSFKDGVLFVTYSSLISKCKRMTKGCFKSRYDQILKWFGKDYDGVIVLDECHKAKNFKKTQTGKVVEKLQNHLRQARIVYASATGASEPKHMAYMVRLGLWGPGQPFQRFDEFENSLTKHGVGAMELVAMEMKRKGMYLARQLSFEGVQFKIREMKIDQCMINGYRFDHIYNQSVLLWNFIYDEFKIALKRNSAAFDKDDNSFESQFWSAHQRFFKYLCISAKVTECVAISMEAIEQGLCVVIGLQSTGESSIVDSLEENDGEINKCVSNAEGVLKSLIKNHYPSLRNLRRNQEAKFFKLITKSENIPRNGPKRSKPKKETQKQYDSESEASERSDDSSESELDEQEISFIKRNQILQSTMKEEQDKIKEDNEMEDRFSEDFIGQQKLLDRIEKMSDMFPSNALDELIKQFGGPEYVAELTGRKVHMVGQEGSGSYQSRREGDAGLDQINLMEKDRFNKGEKIVAIISDAASTGISLHSDERFQNHRKRLHITLELPWSADKAIQQFGRTHRSNQCTPPHYLFLISDLPGERRFAATVAKRLESLGALTHGDRRCADTRDLSQFNLDTEFGLKAVKELIKTIISHVDVSVPFPAEYFAMYGNNKDLFKKHAIKALTSVGLECSKSITVTKFLNRLLGIELGMQKALFQYFLDWITHESEQAKIINKFDHGIRDIMNDSDNIFKTEIDEIPLGENGYSYGHSVKIHKITNKFMGVTSDMANKIYRKDIDENMYCQSVNSAVKILALAEYLGHDKFRLITPNLPEKLIDRQTLYRSYEKIDCEKVKRYWDHLYIESELKCMHAVCNLCCPGNKMFCTDGRRTKEQYIMTGDLFLAWKKISNSLSGLRMQIVRVQLHDKSKLVGALISPQCIDNIRNILNTKPYN